MANRARTLEDMVNPAFWAGKKVFLTGHTGFKGSWLALWLDQLGASVTGYALPPPTTPALFDSIRIAELLNSQIGDIRDPERLTRSLHQARPDIIFHLAAQPLVSEGYRDPVATYATNVTGTLNLLEAARKLDSLQAMVIITTDKCYENRESNHAYQEDDALGGHDPYSSSKACTEILTHAWRRSFFSAPEQPKIASARAGNVIGGGDWAENRLLPDLLRAFSAGHAAVLRNPEAIRPWQHVLEPLAGYLLLAEQLCSGKARHWAWNFGPCLEDCLPVRSVADHVLACWPEPACWHPEVSNFPHEAGLLRIDATLAQDKLGWTPRWNLREAIQETVAWHLAWKAGENMQDFSRQQIGRYTQKPNPQ